MVFKYPIRTRYSETAQDGIIHHSSFVIYLEEARVEFFKSKGCDINEIEKNKLLCPVVNLSLKYLKPLRSCEDIEVHVTVKEISKVRFSLNYEIYNAKSELVAQGFVENCFLNAAFKPIAIPFSLI